MKGYMLGIGWDEGQGGTVQQNRMPAMHIISGFPKAILNK